MRNFLFALVFVSVGCGAEMPTPPTPLDNTEWSIAATTATCGADVAFAKGDYTWSYECIASDGARVGSTERGTFEVTGDSVTTTAHEATCPADQIVRTLTGTFTIEDDHLWLGGGHGVLYFARATASGIAPSIVVGCFEAGVGFVPRPLSPL